MLNVRSVADMARTIAENLHLIDRRAYDCVVGIPRSGMIPASIIATLLQMPLADVAGFAVGIVHGRGGKSLKPGARVLLVDDSVNEGRAMSRAASLLPNAKVTRLCVYAPYKPEGMAHVDIALEECPGPRIFAWNLWKHRRLPRWGFDMDGVFCRDPLKSENDDGERYRAFLSSAEPAFLPSRPIGHIVTARLEKYRRETEAWLGRHGVQFEALHMMPYTSKAERMAAGNRGGWKAEQVKRLGVEMFIESCPKQAGIIAREAGVPVWCTRTQELARC